MLRAVKLNDEASLITAKIHDIWPNDLLTIDRDRKSLQKVIPKATFFFRHVSPEKLGVFCKRWIAVIHRRLQKCGFLPHPSARDARCHLPPRGRHGAGAGRGSFAFFAPAAKTAILQRRRQRDPHSPLQRSPRWVALIRRKCAHFRHLPPRGRHGAGAGRGSFAFIHPRRRTEMPPGEGMGDAYRPKVSSGGKARVMRTGQRLPLGEAVAKRLMRGTVVSKKLRYPRPRRPRSARSVPPCASRAADRDARRRPCRG